MCTIVFYILNLTSNSLVNAQDLTEETIQNYAQNVHDSLYYELFKANRTSDYDLAISYCQRGIVLSRSYKHPQFEVKFYNAIGWLKQQQGKYTESEQNYRKGIDIARELGAKDRLMFFYNNLGVLFEAQTRYDDALENYFKSMDYARELGSKKDQVVTLNNIGLVYYRIGQYQQGIDYLTQGINIAGKENMETELVFSYTNRGLCLIELKRYKEGLKNFTEAERLCKLQGGCDNQSMTDIYYGLGSSQYFMGNFKESEQYFTTGFDFAVKSNNAVSLSLYFYFQSKLLVEEEQYEQALTLLDSSNHHAHRVQSKIRILNNLELYSEIYERLKDTEQALKYKNLYIATKDSIFSNSLKENLNKIQLQEAQKEKQAIIDRQNQVIEQRNLIIILTLIAFALTGSVGVLLYKLNNANKRSKIELEDVVSKRTAELKLSNRKLRAANKEYDNFIYRTYHDLRGPLATITGLTRVAGMESTITGVQAHLQHISNTTSKLTSTLNNLIMVNELKSRELNFQVVNLRVQIEEIYHQVKSPDCKVKFTIASVEEGGGSIITDKMLCILLLRELVKNALFYSKDEEGEVIVKIMKNRANITEVEVSNNGVDIPESIGNKVFDIFIVGSERHGEGLGLYLAQVAAERIGATISIKKFANPVTFSVYFPPREN